MDFEWDPAKSDRTSLERGFDFVRASRIFDGPVLESVDLRHDYGELRVVAIGAVAEDIFVVTYTDRGEVRRIISARQANRRERRLWLSFERP